MKEALAHGVDGVVHLVADDTPAPRSSARRSRSAASPFWRSWRTTPTPGPAQGRGAGADRGLHPGTRSGPRLRRCARLGALTPFQNPRFSLYFTGQVVSNTGTWFQNLALSLVILEATGSAQALSGVTIAQFLPLLVLGIPAGRLADRIRPRTILLCTSAASALVVAVLAIVLLRRELRRSGRSMRWCCSSGSQEPSTVSRLRRSSSSSSAEPASSRAVSISTIALAAARSIGPGLAGIAFVALGPSMCMVLNAASFVVVFASIAAIRPSRLYPRPPPTARGRSRRPRHCAAVRS